MNRPIKIRKINKRSFKLNKFKEEINETYAFLCFTPISGESISRFTEEYNNFDTSSNINFNRIRTFKKNWWGMTYNINVQIALGIIDWVDQYTGMTAIDYGFTTDYNNDSRKYALSYEIVEQLKYLDIVHF